MTLLRQKQPSHFERWIPWLCRIVVALVFLRVGVSKFGGQLWVEIFDNLGFGQWLRYFTGALQVGGALLVLIPRTFPVGILMLAFTMLGAMISWVFFLGAPLNAIIPGALLAGLLFVGAEKLFVH